MNLPEPNGLALQNEVPVSSDFVEFAEENQADIRPISDIEHHANHLGALSLRTIQTFYCDERLPQTKNANDESPKIEVHYIETNSLPNAVVQKINKTHCCAVDSKMLPGLWEIACHAVSTGGVFADLYERDRILRPPFKRGGSVGFLSSVARNPDEYSELLRRITPTNEQALNFAAMLFESMIEYVWLHEVGHIMMGHLEYLKAYRLMPRLYEISPFCNEAQGIDNRMRQLLEAVADEEAFFTQTSGLFIKTTQSLWKGKARLGDTEALAIRLLGMLLVQWHWIRIEGIILKNNIFDMMADREHPAATTRMFAFFFLSGSLLSGVNRHSSRDIMADALGILAENINKLALSTVEFLVLRQLFDHNKVREVSSAFVNAIRPSDEQKALLYRLRFVVDR